jgi:adenine-specific DNA-methyltransferase
MTTRLPPQTFEFGVRRLAAAFSTEPASWRAKSGSKLPHSKMQDRSQGLIHEPPLSQPRQQAGAQKAGASSRTPKQERRMAQNRGNKPIAVETVKHKDKRTNIPTEELRDFVAEEEKKPKTVLYPRDPSLDPQLVWKGKDEQDSADLEVPVVPVYIQEKIHPQALIEDFRRTAQEGQPAQADLFSDFNGIQFEELIDFYHHEQNWSNRMILGDSLLVMTSLAEKEGLKGKVQMIYLDPPYGINFGSNWQVSTRKRDVKDGRAEDMTRQPEQIRAFRDTWKLEIHSYLAYLRDRLTVARDLLTESGSVFVQIGDENVHLVRNVLDEVFGSENFISIITFRTTSDRGGKTLVQTVITCFGMEKTQIQSNSGHCLRHVSIKMISELDIRG